MKFTRWDKCDKCPFVIKSHSKEFSQTAFCGPSHRVIHDPTKIPYWCKAPDYIEPEIQFRRWEPKDIRQGPRTEFTDCDETETIKDVNTRKCAYRGCMKTPLQWSSYCDGHFVIKIRDKDYGKKVPE